MAPKTKTRDVADILAAALAERERRLALVGAADAKVTAAIAERDQLAAAVTAGLAEAAREINRRADVLFQEVLAAFRAAEESALAGDTSQAQAQWFAAQTLMERHKATIRRELLPALRRLPGYGNAHLQRRWPSGLTADRSIPPPGCHPRSYDEWLHDVLAAAQKRRHDEALRAAFAARNGAGAAGAAEVDARDEATHQAMLELAEREPTIVDDDENEN